jgi:hypothetical protein
VSGYRSVDLRWRHFAWDLIKHFQNPSTDMHLSYWNPGEIQDISGLENNSTTNPCLLTT